MASPITQPAAGVTMRSLIESFWFGSPAYFQRVEAATVVKNDAPTPRPLPRAIW